MGEDDLALARVLLDRWQAYADVLREELVKAWGREISPGEAAAFTAEAERRRKARIEARPSGGTR